ncbi:unnamed protein product [Cylicostephanus goldi]|uniref:Uncharacterized protein n=1 Tax=Cylicostephanus goldi TaxID=71465 RepID=A0A3P7NMG0_CYLGO|nr:unnamed protein product [Cylicostephanus goldi]
MLERFSKARHRTIFFSNEKILTVEQVFNRQNTRIIFKSLKEANSKSQLVQTVTSDGKMPLIFVPQGIKVDAATYLDTKLKKELFANRYPFYAERLVLPAGQRSCAQGEGCSSMASEQRQDLHYDCRMASVRRI